jgi:site-specific recombinase XerD
MDEQTALILSEPPSLLLMGEGRADHNPALIYLMSLSEGSRPAMINALQTIAEIITGHDEIDFTTIPWAQLRFQHTTAVRAKLAQKYTHTTANKMLSALRGTLKAAWQLGQMSAEDYHKAVSVKSVQGESLPAGRAIKSGELVTLLDNCDQSELGIRDAAVISLLYGCGLRRAEVVGLDLADYIIEESHLKVRGKRNKQRLVPVVGGVAEALSDWLVVRGNAPGSLFVGVGNRNRGRRLTTQAVYKMLQTRASEAGISNLSPHDFRRTFVGDLLDRGADIATVQKLAGHANVTTTARYDRRGEKAKKRAAEMLHVPYTKRVLGEH